MRFTGFAHFPNGTSRTLASLEEAVAVHDFPGGTAWLDLEQPCEDDVRGLCRLVRLEDETINDCLRGQPRPRIDEFDSYCYFIFYSVRGPKDEDGYYPRKLSVILTPRLLITIHPDPMLCTRQLIERFGKQPVSPLARGVDILTCELVDILADNYQHVAEHYEEELEDLEELSLNPENSDGILEKVGALRRCMIDLRRLSVAEHEVMSYLARGELSQVSRREAKRARRARDHLMKVVERMDALRELLHGVHDNYRAVLATRGNDVMRVLTAYAGITLPLTLVVGVFGMNFPFHPLPDSPTSFWTVVLLMLVAALGMIWYFRHNKWI